MSERLDRELASRNDLVSEHYRAADGEGFRVAGCFFLGGVGAGIGAGSSWAVTGFGVNSTVREKMRLNGLLDSRGVTETVCGTYPGCAKITVNSLLVLTSSEHGVLQVGPIDVVATAPAGTEVSWIVPERLDHFHDDHPENGV